MRRASGAPSHSKRVGAMWSPRGLPHPQGRLPPRTGVRGFLRLRPRTQMVSPTRLCRYKLLYHRRPQITVMGLPLALTSSLLPRPGGAQTPPRRPRAPGAGATVPPTGRAEGTGGQLHDVHEELTGVPHGLLEGLATACQLRGDSSQLPDRWPARWPTHHCVGLGQGVQWGEPWGNG